MLDFPRVYAFCELAECLNFTEAADRLYTSQSSLSKNIASFEASIGCKLFERNNRSVSLTPAGEYLYEYFKSSLSEMGTALNKARSINEGKKSFITIGITGMSTVDRRICSLLNGFLNEHPDIGYVFVTKSLNELRSDLTSGRIDAVITKRLEMQGLKNVEYVPVTLSRACIAVRPEHPVLEGRESLCLADVRDYPFVSMTMSGTPGLYTMLYGSCSTAGFVPRVELFVSSIQALLMHIAVSDCVGIIDALEGGNPDVVRLFPLDTTQKAVVTVAAYNTQHMSESLTLLIDYLNKNTI